MKIQNVFLLAIATFFMLCTGSLVAQVGGPASLSVKPAKNGFNRYVRNFEVIPGQSGQAHVRLNVGLIVSDKSRKSLNMNFDIQILINGQLKKVIRQNVAKNGAIYCAVTCSGKCPSIFGDGVCTGCGCSYNNWFSATFGGSDAKPGNVFEVRLVPARRGLKDDKPDDDRRRMILRVPQR